MSESGNSSSDLKNVLKYLEVLIRRRWIIIGFSIPVEILVIFFLLTATPKYTATVTILPTEESASNVGTAALLKQVTGIGTPRRLSNPVLYKQILTSRSLIAKVLKKKFYSEELGAEEPLLDILRVKGERFEERLQIGHAILAGRMIEVNLSRETGITTIDVVSTEPKLSADIAWMLVRELDAFNREHVSNKARENRIFIEGRIEETQGLLSISEEDLKEFRETNKRIEKSPQLQLERGRLLREVKVQEEVYLTLKRELEMVRIEEVKNIPIIRILDEPFAPMYRSWPKRKKTAALAGMLALGTGIFLAFFTDFMVNTYSDDSVMSLVKSMVGMIRNDYDSIRRKLRRSHKIQ